MVDQTGQTQWSAHMTSYGRVRLTAGTRAQCPFRFQGQYEDVETGLYYNRFRYYSPEEGIYISQDPVKLQGRNANLYAYVQDPSQTIDAFGLAPCDIPKHKNGAFGEWFDKLTPDELDVHWADDATREVIEARLRAPGKMHEWLMVSRTPVFKRWGKSFDDIEDLRTAIKDVKFKNPDGWHGGPGSTTAHNEILDIIGKSTDYSDYVRRLNTWADGRLVGGVAGLPPGLQLP